MLHATWCKGVDTMNEIENQKLEGPIRPGFKDYIAIAIAIFEIVMPMVLIALAILGIVMFIGSRYWS